MTHTVLVFPELNPAPKSPIKHLSFKCIDELLRPLFYWLEFFRTTWLPLFFLIVKPKSFHLFPWYLFFQCRLTDPWRPILPVSYLLNVDQISVEPFTHTLIPSSLCSSLKHVQLHSAFLRAGLRQMAVIDRWSGNLLSHQSRSYCQYFSLHVCLYSPFIKASRKKGGSAKAVLLWFRHAHLFTWRF